MLTICANAAHAQTTVAIRGRVVDQNGRTVESVQIALTPGSRGTISFDDGTFEIRGITAGDYVLSARRIGYQAASTKVALRDSMTVVNITLVVIPAQLDSIRIHEKKSGISYSAVVLDQNDAPVVDAEVVAIGVSKKFTTDSQGRFAVPGLSSGTLVVRMRKMGYRAYLNSFRLLSDRADTLRMPRLSTSLMPVEIKEQSGFGNDYWALRDMQQRLSWKGAMAGAISREELAQEGAVNLCDALPNTASGNRLSLRNDQHCKIFPEGMRNILIDGVRCVHGLLADYSADQVEMVEYFPGGDLSGSLRARRCGPPAFVIWTRKKADASAASVPPPPGSH